jgi:TetR/AcrR family hemagglutinin/protease transcriptional regulator
MRTRLQPEQRRTQLLDCAIAAFAENGIARATHAHVAGQAQISVPAVHSYFRTREDLVAATLAEVEIRLMPIAAEAVRHGPTARAALTAMVEGFDRAARETPDLIKVWLDWSTGFRADVWPGFLTMQERLHKLVGKTLARAKRSGELAQGLNTRATARLFIGGGRTVALLRFSGASEAEIKTLIRHLIVSIMTLDPDSP